MPLHVCTRAHHQEAKIVLYSLWYHHTETSEWSKITKITKIQFYKYEHIVVQLMCEYTIITPEKFTHKLYYYVFILIELYFSNFSYFCNFNHSTCFSVMIPETV